MDSAFYSVEANIGLGRILLKAFKRRGLAISIMMLVLAVATGGGVAQGAAGQGPEYDSVASGLTSVDVAAAATDIEVDKDVQPARISAGDSVVYTVTFANKGRDDGMLEEIQDTLPAGFSFVAIDDGSDIQQAPTGTTGNIVWDGPFEVPAKDSLTLIYRVNAGGSAPNAANTVIAVVDGQTVGPASATVQVDKRYFFLPMIRRSFSYANFSIAKSASPTQLNVDEMVTYTVLLRNEGDLPGKLDRISDALPEGFTFDSMVTGSDIMTAPAGTTGTIVWNADRDVAPKAEVKLIYKAKAGADGGAFTNSVTATTLVGFPPEKPAEATVQVKQPSAFEDDFEDGIGEWTAYTNAKRANEDMWFWDRGAGRHGSDAYTLNAMSADLEKWFAHDALSMYLGEGSEEWTDYRYSVWFNMLGGRQAGIWLRGTYRDSEQDGQWLTGYYFTVKVRDDERDTARLWQLRTVEEHGDEIHDYYWYHYQNPFLLEEFHLETANVEKGTWAELTVEVRGNNIKGYVDGELAIDFTDTVGSVFRTGTIGLYAYGSEPVYAVVNFDDVKVEPLD